MRAYRDGLRAWKMGSGLVKRGQEKMQFVGCKAVFYANMDSPFSECYTIRFWIVSMPYQYFEKHTST